MDIKLGLAIYNKLWAIHPESALSLLDFWEDIKSGKATWSAQKEENPVIAALEAQKKLFAKSGVTVSPTARWELRDFEGFEGSKVVVIPVTGPIMKHDFCGEFGTKSLMRMNELANEARSVETIIYLVDSPGGTVDGTKAFADSIENSVKSTHTVVDGMMASAGYWIGGSAKRVSASTSTDIIGCIGTMCAWRDYTKADADRGVVLREYYATASTNKNKAMSDANKGDGRLLIAELLDPLNNEFLAAVKRNRAGKLNLTMDPLSGKDFTGEAAIKAGLVDDIQSFNSVLNQALSANYKTKKPTMSSPNKFQTVMKVVDASEFQVVDGGFLLTEDQLNALNAKLEQDATTASATANQLQLLQAGKTAADAAIEENKSLKASNEDLTKQLAAKDQELAAAKESAKNLQDAGQSFFSNQAGTGEDPKENGSETMNAESFDHNKAADALLG